MRPSAWAHREKKYKQDLEQYCATIGQQAEQLAALRAQVEALEEGSSVGCAAAVPCAQHLHVVRCCAPHLVLCCVRCVVPPSVCMHVLYCAAIVVLQQ